MMSICKVSAPPERHAAHRERLAGAQVDWAADAALAVRVRVQVGGGGQVAACATLKDGLQHVALPIQQDGRAALAPSVPRPQQHPSRSRRPPAQALASVTGMLQQDTALCDPLTCTAS